MTKPIWLLDVDGVLNALGTPHWDDESKREQIATDNGTFWITWSPQLMESIKKVADLGVEIRWLTTWGHEANKRLSGLFDLPEFPVEATTNSGYTRSYDWHWKYRAAQKVVIEKRPIIWTDDDAWDDDMKRQYRGFCEDNSIPVLMLQPDLYHGLTPHHLLQIYAFAKENVDS